MLQLSIHTASSKLIQGMYCILMIIFRELNHVFELFPVFRTSEVVMKFKFPVPKVQSVAIGGPNFDILFVTTTRFAPDPSTLPKDSGKLFMIRDFGGKGIDGRKLNKSFASCAKQTFIDKVKQKFSRH